MRSRRQIDRCMARSRNGFVDLSTACCPRLPRRRRSVCRVLLLAAALLLPGCQLNRSFFQMDSNSRVPFFGVDLAPQWPKRSSSVEGVSRLQSEAARQAQIDATTPAVAPERTLALPLSETVVTTTADEGTPAETFR